MSDLTTWRDTLNAISSRALEDGRSQLDWLDGLTVDRFGPAPAPVSHSPSPESKPARKTSATCGRNSSASSVPEGPMSGWENRLRQRLESIGSTECVLTWKASATPAGHQLFRLVPSMRPIGEIDCGLWPTAKDTPGMATTGVNPDGSTRQRIDQLPRQMALYPTPKASAAGPDFAKAGRSATGMALPAIVVIQQLGAEPNGPSEQTEKPGALNPQFVCWLMGFPPEWESCAPMATQSSRKSRRK